MSREDLKIEYLEALHAKSEATKMLVAGAQMIVDGGVEGILVVANEQPALVLNVLVALAAVIEKQNEELLEMAEARLTNLDFIESIADAIVPPK